MGGGRGDEVRKGHGWCGAQCIQVELMGSNRKGLTVYGPP